MSANECILNDLFRVLCVPDHSTSNSEHRALVRVHDLLEVAGRTHAHPHRPLCLESIAQDGVTAPHPVRVRRRHAAAIDTELADKRTKAVRTYGGRYGPLRAVILAAGESKRMGAVKLLM